MHTAPLRALLACFLLLSALPAAAHTGHTSMDLTCADPSPNSASAHGTLSCSFVLNPSGDFGLTDIDKPDTFTLLLPVDMQVNEDGSHDGADPSDGEQVGQVTVVGDLGYNGCPGGTPDGGTYSMSWEDTWTSYTPPSGWTKVSQFDTVITVFFFVTGRMTTHVVKNSSTGQYALVTDWPQGLMCTGSELVFDPFTVYGRAGNRNTGAWVLKNPSTAGHYDVCLEAVEVGGTVHEDCDVITIA